MRSRARAGLGIALFLSLLAAMVGLSGVGATAAPYATASTVTMDVSKHKPLVKQGERPTITVTVSSVAAPVGTVVFTVTRVSDSQVVATSAEAAVAPVSDTSSTADYIFPGDLAAQQTYQVTAVFSATDARFANSSSTPIFVTVLPGGSSLS